MLLLLVLENGVLRAFVDVYSSGCRPGMARSGNVAAICTDDSMYIRFVERAPRYEEKRIARMVLETEDVFAAAWIDELEEIALSSGSKIFLLDTVLCIDNAESCYAFDKKLFLYRNYDTVFAIVSKDLADKSMAVEGFKIIFVSANGIKLFIDCSDVLCRPYAARKVYENDRYIVFEPDRSADLMSLIPEGDPYEIIGSHILVRVLSIRSLRGEKNIALEVYRSVIETVIELVKRKRGNCRKCNVANLLNIDYGFGTPIYIHIGYDDAKIEITEIPGKTVTLEIVETVRGDLKATMCLEYIDCREVPLNKVVEEVTKILSQK